MRKWLLSLLVLFLLISTANAATKVPSKDVTTDVSQFGGNIPTSATSVQSALKAINDATFGGDPAGTSGQFQYNNGGIFAGGNMLYTDGTNVGVGTSTPAATLDVSGNIKVGGTGSSILFANGKSINGDTASQLTFDSNLEIDGGKIYSLGAAGLTKTSTNNNGQIVIRKTGGYSLATAGLSVIGTDNFGGTIVMAQDTNAALTSGKYLGQLLFTGSYEASHNLQNGGAAIFGISTGTWSATANPSKLTFEIGDGSVFYRLQRMQITPTGTTIGTSNSTTSALLSVGDSAPTKNYIDGTNDIIAKDSIEANGDMYARGNVIAYTNLGVGTPSPSTQLHVVGGARITGLVSCDTINTDANGVMSCGTDATAGSIATDTIWDAKGDLVGGTGADTSARLAVGTNGQVLTADSAETTGMKWSTISGTGDALVSNPLSQFAATTSAELAGVISNETGSGSLVFATSPTFTTPTLGAASATSVSCTNGINIGSSLTYTSGSTTGSIINVTPNSLTSGNAILGSSSSNSMTGSIFSGTYSGTNSGKVANFVTSNASASGTTLRVYNLGTGNSVTVEDDTTTDSTPFVIDSSGNVGIKTSAPGKDLDVTGEIRASSSITSTATNDIGWSIQTGANTACNTTCTNACVHGWDTASGEIAVSCSDTTADKCLCAGAS